MDDVDSRSERYVTEMFVLLKVYFVSCRNGSISKSHPEKSFVPCPKYVSKPC